jgi:hypothetical protein
MAAASHDADVIPSWMDRESRVWMDTGKLHPKSEEPIIELLNGEARGSLSWVDKQFGPLERLGVVRE